MVGFFGFTHSFFWYKYPFIAIGSSFLCYCKFPESFVITYGGLFDLVTKRETRKMVCVVFRCFDVVGTTVAIICWFYQRFFFLLFRFNTSKCGSIFGLVFYKAYFKSKSCFREGECYFVEV